MEWVHSIQAFFIWVLRGAFTQHDKGPARQRQPIKCETVKQQVTPHA
jgi:hypothetical protein